MLRPSPKPQPASMRCTRDPDCLRSSTRQARMPSARARSVLPSGTTSPASSGASSRATQATQTDSDGCLCASRAFVWPSYARARAPEAHLQHGDAFADAIHTDAQPEGVIVLLSPIERASDSMRRGTRSDARNAPHVGRSGASVAPRHIGRVLRDFEDAVARGDAAATHDLLDEAWSTGRLSVVNRSFLQTRELAAQRDWQAVLDHALRHRLSDLDLPRPVEHDLVKAIYWGVLRDALDRGDVASAVDAFRDRVQPALGDIFKVTIGSGSSAGGRAGHGWCGGQP